MENQQPPQPEPSQTPVPEIDLTQTVDTQPAKKTTTLLKLLGLIFMFVIVTGAGVFAYMRDQQTVEQEIVEVKNNTVATPNETFPDGEVITAGSSEGWKQYSNNRCDDVRGISQFSIEVPEDWVITSSVTSDPSSTQSYTFTGENNSQVKILCGDGFGGGGCEDGGGVLENIRIGDQELIACVRNTDTTYSSGSIYLNMENATFVLDARTENSQSSVDQVQKILSTFTLKQMTQTENLQTYSNTEFGYSLQYPSTWTGSSNAPGKTSSEISQEAQMIDFSPSDNTAPYPVNLLTVQALELAPSYTQPTVETVNGKQVITQRAGFDNFDSVTYLLGDDESGYVEFLYRYEKGVEDLSTVHQILGSLEFVK